MKPVFSSQAIPLGVFKHLASLTMRTEESEMKWIDDLYPLYASMLRSAQLMHEEFPTLGEVLDEIASNPRWLNGRR